MLDGSWQLVDICDLVQDLLECTKDVLIFDPRLEPSAEADKDADKVAELLELATLASFIELLD